MVSAIRTVGKRLKEEVKRILKSFLKIDVYIKRIRAIGGGLVVELEDIENKIEIMKYKREMREVNIWLDHDLTDREKHVQK